MTPSSDLRLRDGVVLRYSVRGHGERRAILVSPGIFMHRELDEHRELAERLSGVADVVTVDARGHGDSGGRFSFGLKEPDDLAELARVLHLRYARLGALGFSFGGYNTAIAAARHRCFDAVALVGTPHRLFLLDHNFLTLGLLRSIPLAVRRRRRRVRLDPTPPPRGQRPSDLVAQISPTPLFVAHGADDWLVPVSHARLLFERAREPKRLLVLAKGLHAENILSDDPESLVAPLAAFFQETLL